MGARREKAALSGGVRAPPSEIAPTGSGRAGTEETKCPSGSIAQFPRHPGTAIGAVQQGKSRP